MSTRFTPGKRAYLLWLMDLATGERWTDPRRSERDHPWWRGLTARRMAAADRADRKAKRRTT